MMKKVKIRTEEDLENQYEDKVVEVESCDIKFRLIERGTLHADVSVSEEEADYSILSFEIEGVLSPEDLAALTPPKVDGSKGVILSGRGPIWVYCFLTHFYHPTKFIATYDPRLGGAVIVESHAKMYHVGMVFKC